tara:strand:- start:44 stop:679 length:636 start_codon:yes stop_codon:yes gene_type:complete
MQQVVTITTASRTASSFLTDFYEQNDYKIVWQANNVSFHDDHYVYNNTPIVDNKIVFHNHVPQWLPPIPTNVVLSSRYDKLAQALSKIILTHVDQFISDDIRPKLGLVINPNAAYQDPIAIEPLFVDPAFLLQQIEMIIEFENAATNIYRKNNIEYKIVYYEDVISSKQDGLLAELGLKKIRPNYYQKSRFQSSEIVSNYDELVNLNWRKL